MGRGIKKRDRIKKNRMKTIFCIVLLLMVVIGILHFTRKVPIEKEHFSQLSMDNSSNEKDKLGLIDEEVVTLDLSNLYSKNMILLDYSTGNILSQKGMDERIYPASMTKIMTCFVAIQYENDFEKKVTISEDIFEDLYHEGASMAGFEAGEEVTIRDLLYGLMLPSGAECSLTLAKDIAGTEQQFVLLMNEFAADLGLTETHFANTTGLHDLNHYSSVKDIANLLKYALQNEKFREIFEAHSWRSDPTNLHPEGVLMNSMLFRYIDSAEVNGGEIIGGKTGYTGEAGLCLASVATIWNHEYILVTAGAEGSHNTEQFHIYDAFNIYNQVGEKKGENSYE